VRALFRLLGDVDEFFFPADCYLCGQPLRRRRVLLVCRACRAAFTPVHGTACALCRTVERDRLGFAAGRDCRDPGHAGFRVHAAVQMVSPADRLVHALKFHDRPEVGATMALVMARRLAANRAREWHLVAPLPLHRTRERERGYNQGLVLAEPLARRLEAGLEPRLLTRVRATGRQADLDHAARGANVAGAFRLRDRRRAAIAERLAGRRVLLVDDVATTGHTLVEALRAVAGAGAETAAAVFALA
jgi:ComF family protein